MRIDSWYPRSNGTRITKTGGHWKEHWSGCDEAELVISAYTTKGEDRCSDTRRLVAGVQWGGWTDGAPFCDQKGGVLSATWQPASMGARCRWWDVVLKGN